MPRPRLAPPTRAARSAPAARTRLGFGTPVDWVGLGGWVGVALGGWMGCASSDAVLQKEQRRRELERADQSCYGSVTEACYTGPSESAGRGACRRGTRTCVDGTWGPCAGEALPAEESCNGLDDDCDGIVDDGFERDGALCFRGHALGACKTQGRWRCAEDGSSSVCDAPEVRPSAEICDEIDNDCDGEIDEDSIAPDERDCHTHRAGVCGPGTHRCISGRIRCIQDVQPGAEVCNGLDDDCDNDVDENCVRMAQEAP